MAVDIKIFESMLVPDERKNPRKRCGSPVNERDLPISKQGRVEKYYQLRCPQNVSVSNQKIVKQRGEQTSNVPLRTIDQAGVPFRILSDLSLSNNKNKAGKNETHQIPVEISFRKEDLSESVKWTFLQHNGPLFPPAYDPLPAEVSLLYKGRPVRLSDKAEEVAVFYARLLPNNYTKKALFNKNFFNDWRKVMTNNERELITDLKKCDFTKIYNYLEHKKQFMRKNIPHSQSTEEIKRRNKEIEDRYGYCIIDGHKEKIQNFRMEPPGLFRGRGVHPLTGKLKERVLPEDVIINCSKDSKIPVPPPGHRWKEVRHDNTVMWLDSWTDSILGNAKYIFLSHDSFLNSKNEWRKFENARKLNYHINKIRQNYRKDLKSPDIRVRQRAVAVYLIDRLSLRIGMEKDNDCADTVGCCTLRTEHVAMGRSGYGGKCVVKFDFPGKDSIRFQRKVVIEPAVYRNLKEFLAGKRRRELVFDQLNPQSLNVFLKQLMPGLTTRVFRTYNASTTLQNELHKRTKPNSSLQEKLHAYRCANRAAALICNHQRSVPKGYHKTARKLKNRMKQKDIQICRLRAKLKHVKDRRASQKLKKVVHKLKEQKYRIQLKQIDHEENKTLALGTSKLNYLDPRITVAWCKKHRVPIEKVFNKTQRKRFKWANMVGPRFRF